MQHLAYIHLHVYVQNSPCSLQHHTRFDALFSISKRILQLQGVKKRRGRLQHDAMASFGERQSVG